MSKYLTIALILSAVLAVNYDDYTKCLADKGCTNANSSCGGDKECEAGNI